MTKAYLVDHLATATQRSKKESEQVVDELFAGISKALASGEKLDIRGFGSFKIRESKAKTGRNPRTGEALSIAAKKVAVFKPSKELAEKVNTGGAPA